MTDNAGYRPTDDSALRWEDCHCTKCGQPDKKCECVALTPGTKVIPTSNERLSQIREHDFPILLEFHSKHALGPLTRPSCLVCGRVPEQWPPAIQHAELPGIVVCHPCRDRATHETSERQEMVVLRPCAIHQGMTFFATVGYRPPLREVCPGCEKWPPEVTSEKAGACPPIDAKLNASIEAVAKVLQEEAASDPTFPVRGVANYAGLAGRIIRAVAGSKEKS